LGPAAGFSAYDVPARFLARDSGLFINRAGPSLGLLVFLVGAFVAIVGGLAAVLGGILTLVRR